MRSGRVALVAGFALLLVVSVFVLAQGTGRSERFCQLDGYFVERPPGWEWRRDAMNDCQWTLFDASGQRASDEIYADLGLTPPPPPPTIPSVLGLLGVVLALSGLGLLVSRRDASSEEPVVSTGVSSADRG